MLEVFLFINPIGQRCRDAEHAVVRLASELAAPVDLHFVPLLNFHIIEQFMARRQLDCRDLDLRNRIFEAAYQVTLDYKAAQYQGNKKARALLIAEQEMFEDGCWAYDPAFAMACVRAYHLDVETFSADRQHEANANSFSPEQKIAQDMGITETPTIVLFDTSQPEADGIKLKRLPDYQTLKHLCQTLLHQQPEKTLLRIL